MFKLDELLTACGGKLSRAGRVTAITGISIDTRNIKPGNAFLAIRGKNFDGHSFIAQAMRRGASCIIHDSKMKQPGSLRHAAAFIEVKNTGRALGLIANFQRRKYNPAVVAVTGSTGKTTCKEMIASVLGAKLRVLKNEGTKNNQIGVPVTLLGLDGSHEAVILELGTNHFGEIACLGGIAEPNIAVITNVGNSHLEYFGDKRGVWREKASLLKSLRNPAVALLNSDDPFQRPLINAPGGFFVLSCGVVNRGDFTVSRIKTLPSGVEFLINERYKFRLNTPGAHNVYNAVMAVAVGSLFGISVQESSRRLKAFRFPAGRLNLRRINGITFIDDTYNSNPSSLKEAVAALKNFSAPGRKILVMGDMLELGRARRGFHQQAGKLMRGACDILITCGRLSRLAAGKAALDKKYIYSCLTSSQARDILLNRICPTARDVVLVKGSRAMKMEEVMR